MIHILVILILHTFILLYVCTTQCVVSTIHTSCLIVYTKYEDASSTKIAYYIKHSLFVCDNKLPFQYRICSKFVTNNL